MVEASWQDISRGRYTSDMKAQSALQSVIDMQVRRKVPFMFVVTEAAHRIIQIISRKRTLE